MPETRDKGLTQAWLYTCCAAISACVCSSSAHCSFDDCQRQFQNLSMFLFVCVSVCENILYYASVCGVVLLSVLVCDPRLCVCVVLSVCYSAFVFSGLAVLSVVLGHPVSLP